MLNPGNPGDKCTSMVTDGADMPTLARLWMIARDMRGIACLRARLPG